MAAPATADRKDVIGDAHDNSAQISTLVRTTAVGLLAIAWGFLVTPEHRIPSPSALIILGVIGFAVLGLLLDWLQYLTAYIDSNSRRREMEEKPALRGWDPTTFCYRCRTVCFAAKQVAVGVAAVLLLVGIGRSIAVLLS